MYKNLILKCNPNFIEMDLKYTLINRKKQNKFRIYIIGHTNIKAIAEEIIIKLNNEFPEKIEFIYRYHPTEVVWKLKNSSIEILYEVPQDFINEFDLVINYGSSFYDNCEFFNRKPEIKWDNLADEIALRKIIDEIKVILENSS